MATQRTTYGKRERDRARQAKAAAKRERRQARSAETDGDVPAPPAGADADELTPAQLFAEIEEVHRAFAAEEISHEDFEAKKAELLARLPID